MTHHQSEVPLVALADLGITSHRGRGWAREEIITTLADAGCPPPPPGPVTELTLDVAGALLARAVAGALPEPLELVDDVIWGPPDTDHFSLHAQAMHRRDQAAIGEIVARTGLWSPPDPTLMPTVRVEARADEITTEGRRIGALATRGTAQYWAVYGVRPDGTVDLAADFATEHVARRHAARWQRPGLLITADHTEVLPTPRTADIPAASSRWRSPRSASHSDLTRSPGAHLHAAHP